MNVYRLFDSDQGYAEVTVNGLLEAAIVATGMKRPRKAQSFCDGEWINITPQALSRAIVLVAA